MEKLCKHYTDTFEHLKNKKKQADKGEAEGLTAADPEHAKSLTETLEIPKFKDGELEFGPAVVVMQTLHDKHHANKGTRDATPDHTVRYDVDIKYYGYYQNGM